MNIPCTSLLALSLLTSLAVAGADAPATGTLDVVDPQLDPMPPAAAAYADIVSARLEVVDGETLRATIELAAMPEAQPGVAYVLVFSADDAPHYAALAMVPLQNYVYGAWGGVGPDTMEETTGSYTTGVGGSIVVDYPRSTLGDATRLHSPLVYVVDVKSDATGLPLPDAARYLVLDDAQGDGEIILREPAPSDAQPGTAAEAGGKAAAVEAAAVAGDEGAAEAPQDKATPAPTLLVVVVALAVTALARRRG